MKPLLSTTDLESAKADAIEIGLPKRGGKQVIGHARHCDSQGKAVNLYFLEDGSEVMVDDANKTVKKWPEV